MSGWIMPSEVVDAPVRLFCFPHAGGGASAYRDWIKSSQGFVYAMQAPGRENRMTEKLLYSLNDWVQGATDAIWPHICRPYALFGHSLGARIAFEVAREIRRRGGIMPLHLFVSGSLPPEEKEKKPLHELDDTSFIKELHRFGCTREELFSYPELLKLFLPILRADFTVDEVYEYQQESPLNVPITAFCGTEDREASPQQMREWEKYTGSSFELQTLPGNHFFLHEKTNRMPQRLERILHHELELLHSHVLA